MRTFRLGFTLVELVVVIAILGVLSAILFPMFARARESADGSVCLANFRQTHTASTLYQTDYDDTFMVSRYTGAASVEPGTDRTWFQLTLPYLRSIKAAHCPADRTHVSANEAPFEEGVVVGDTWERFYLASMRVNTGYNSVYLAPLVNQGRGRWVSLPRSGSNVGDPSLTLLFGDSAWEVGEDGRPSGGGNYLVIPPCRYMADSNSDTFNLTGVENEQIYRASLRWETLPGGRARTGGLYPRHRGKLTAIMTDGSAKQTSIGRVIDGCDTQPDWSGQVTNPDRYLWDLR